MTLYKQIVRPNLDPVAYDNGKLLLSWRGECLATLRAAFNAPWCGTTATAGWNNTQGRHEDRNFPIGVYFPIWFSGAGGAGHACFAFVNDNGSMNIWTSPWEQEKPYFDNYPSIERLEQGYHITFIGWSECIGSFRVIEAVPDVVPAVEVVPAPAPVPANNTIYTKFDSPLSLVTDRQPTHIWRLDFVTDAQAVSQGELPLGSSFVAYGKAQRTDNDKPCYYMTEADFGQADVTGHPTTNVGINTVDLVTPPVVADPGPVIPEVPGLASASAPMTNVTLVTPVQSIALDGSNQHVGALDWQKTTKNVADYEALEDYPVEDLATGLPTSTLLRGQTVHAAVRFSKEDNEGHLVEYVMTQKSIDAGKFNGVPMAVLKLIKPIDIQLDEDTVLDDLKLDEIDAKNLAGRIIDPLLRNATLREKIVDWVARVVFHAKKQKKM